MQSPWGGAGASAWARAPRRGPPVEAGGPELKPEEVLTYLMLNVG